jgi:Zn-dependent metalloprotease
MASSRGPVALALFGLIGLGALAGLALAAPPPAPPLAAAALERLESESRGAASVRMHPATGVARRVRLVPGVLPMTGATPAARARDFLRRHGAVFGIRDADAELEPGGEWTDDLGRAHVRFRQVHLGLPVFAAELRAHADPQGRIVEVHGTFVPDVDVPTRPRFDAEELVPRAIVRVQEDLPVARGQQLAFEGSRLLVFRTGLLARVEGEAHLAWEIVIGNRRDVRELVYVDALTGKVLDRISGIHSAITRRIHEPELDNVVIWDEGDPLPYNTGNAQNDGQVNELIRSAAGVYQMFQNLSGGTHPSWDGLDGTLHSVWNIGTSICPNAFWDGVATNFCNGVAGDDSTIHEWVHAYTEATHGLIYQWQPGALNEAYSDMYGELADRLNGTGTDAPAPLRTAGQCSTLGGAQPPTLEILAPASIAGVERGGGALFNPAGPVTVNGAVQLANDGTSPATDACQALIGFTPGRIALIDRGTCSFASKVQNAQNAGAAGVIMVNTTGNTAVVLTGSGPGITIPSIGIGNGEGNLIKSQLGVGVSVRLTVTPETDASVRFVFSEDAFGFGGAIRDLWMPECFADPGKVTDREFYICESTDGGGVHTNSGVPNHAFALLLDGGTFNGVTVSALGPTRAAILYWRAMSVYQVPDTDFEDHADALEQSCADLIGVSLVHPWTGLPTGETLTAASCQEVADAIAAVELRIPPSFCNFQPLLAQSAPAVDCGSIPFADDFETNPATRWSRSNTGVFAEYDPRDWEWTSNVPEGGSGSAFFAVDDAATGDCNAGSDDQSGVMFLDSAPFVLDTDHSLLTFEHWVATEPSFDGGNVSASVNGGPFQLVPSGAFTFNPYNRTLISSLGGNTNPIAGQTAFSGTDGGSVGGSWGQSQVNLAFIAGALDSVRLRFSFGVDGCNGRRGWYVDDVRVCGNCAGAGGADVDGDEFRSCDGDCNESSSTTFPGAPELNDGRDNQCPGDTGFGDVDELSGAAGFLTPNDKTRFSWATQANATSYQVARATAPAYTAGCTTFGSASTFIVDPTLPPAGEVFFYLVRPLTPFAGSWGEGRTVPCAAP